MGVYLAFTDLIASITDRSMCLLGRSELPPRLPLQNVTFQDAGTATFPPVLQTQTTPGSLMSGLSPLSTCWIAYGTW